MSNKLQELTEKLYEEGLSKGKEEGARLLAEAQAKAAETVAKAKAEAEAILDKAEKDAAELRSKTESDVKMASAQALQATKKDIESLLVGNILSGKVKSGLEDASFVKEIIKAVAQKFSATEGTDLALVLPASLQGELEPWVNGELAKAIGSEVKADFSKKIAGGFTIGPKDGSYYVSLTEDTFKDLIAEYIRPVTRKLLFGE